MKTSLVLIGKQVQAGFQMPREYRPADKGSIRAAFANRSPPEKPSSAVRRSSVPNSGHPYL
jgi:hypothetical protein